MYEGGCDIGIVIWAGAGAYGMYTGVGIVMWAGAGGGTKAGVGVWYMDSSMGRCRTMVYG